VDSGTKHNSLLFGSFLFSPVVYKFSSTIIAPFSLEGGIMRTMPARIHFLSAQRQAINQFFDQPLASF
jgi:hypothetical protein